MTDQPMTSLQAAAAADAAVDLARRRAAHAWPPRRALEAANRAPVQPDEIEQWLDEEGATLRARYRERNSEVARARRTGYLTAAGVAAALVAWWVYWGLK